jgi:hypothetical protein
MITILQSKDQREALYNILVFFIFVIILTFFMRYLWNSTLVRYIDILKPVDSLWHSFLLSLGIAMFRL